MLEHLPFAGEPNADFRARVARRQAEAAELRQRELVEQASTINSPDLRIRIWERLHEVGLPRTAGHRLLGVIAKQTGLTLDQIQAEQASRALPPLAEVVAAMPPSVISSSATSG